MGPKAGATNQKAASTTLVSLTVIASILAFAGCARSRQYVQERQYYQSDSEFENQTAQSSTDKADKFTTPKKRIFVLPFFNATPFQKKAGAAGGPDDLGVFVADALIREIQNGGKAIVPENLRVADTSRDFYAGDKVRVGSLTREGRKLGLSLLVIGRIKKITYRQKADEMGLLRKRRSLAGVELEMRLFDVTQGRELLFDERGGDSSTAKLNLFNDDDDASDTDDSRVDLVHEAIGNAVQRLGKDIARALDKVSWEGRIAKISGQVVYINAGRKTGLSLGDILKVVSSGEDIYDPSSGAFLGRSAGAVKGTLEVVDYMGPDGAMAKIHSGSGFTENDVVQLY